MMTFYAYGQDLSVSIIPISSKFTEKQDVTVILNYQNKGSQSIMIYKWYLPTEQLFHPLFQVTRDGNPVEYIGPMVKRREPTIEDMISIEPGKTVSTHVKVSSVYDMTKTGDYIIQFKSNTGSMISSSSRSLNIENIVIESSSIKIFAEGRSNILLEEKAKLDLESRATTYSFTGCSSNQKNSIVSAIKSAKTYSSNCVQYLTKFQLPAKSRYTTWFGKYSLNNLITLRKHFTNINTALNTKPMSFDCTCHQKNVFAYVFSNLPYKIYLCNSFWSGPITGTDSKAGTIVHELSHFTIIAGTKDTAYGQQPSKNLAKTNPNAALNNADNHEYFAENKPAL